MSMASTNPSEFSCESIAIPSNVSISRVFDERGLEALASSLGVSLTLYVHKRSLEIMASSLSSCELAKTRIKTLLAEPEMLAATMKSFLEEQIHVYVDYSSVCDGSQMISGLERDTSVRLNDGELIKVVEQGRTARTRMVYQTKTSPSHSLWDTWKKNEYKIHSPEPPEWDDFFGVDEAVDNTIDSDFLMDIETKLVSNQHDRHTLVLVAGDGDDQRTVATFARAASLALKSSKWKVQVWCWRHGLSSRWREHWRPIRGQIKEMGSSDAFEIRYLDDHRSRVTYDDSMGAPMTHCLSCISYEGDSSGLRDADGDCDDNVECPITQELIYDPVKTPHTRHYYERSAIIEHISNQGNCPMSRNELSLEQLSRPTQDYLTQLASAWDRMLLQLPQDERAREEAKVPHFVKEYRSNKYGTAAPQFFSEVLRVPPSKEAIIQQKENDINKQRARRLEEIRRQNKSKPPQPPRQMENPEKYRTALCKRWEESGSCYLGAECYFAHGHNQLLGGSQAEVQRPPTSSGSYYQAPTQECSDYQFRTQLCNRWETSGRCFLGDNCTFAHGEAQLRKRKKNAAQRPPNYRTQLCEYFMANGTCPHGDKCNYAHGRSQLRRP